ncbi:hypothetical protein ACEPPN_000651 [Leptodophora sp. 'Broadleaf-Isolate-01']
MLMKSMSSNIIPPGLMANLRAQDPDQFDAIFPASNLLLEDSLIERDALYIATLWQEVDKIHEEARRCYDHHLNESAWVKVVNMVLGAADIGRQKPFMLRLESIQTQAINAVFLPQHISQSFAKKADLTFSFFPDHPTVQRAIAPIHKYRPSVSLSQMTDPYTSRVPLVCGVEVKERGGDYNEAIIQLGIWCAAALEALQGLRTLGEVEGESGEGEVEEENEREKEGEGERKSLPPFVGWTAMGHDWKFHIAWKDADGDVTIIGPWRLLTGSTCSHFEILLLIRMIQAVKKWQEEDYWSWLDKNVLKRLQRVPTPA